MSIKHLCVIALTLVCMATAAVRAADEGSIYKVKVASLTQPVRFVRNTAGSWSATVEGRTFSLQGRPDTEYRLVVPDGEPVVAKQKGEKIKASRTGKPWMVVKVTPAKIKVRSPGETSDEYKFKFKGDKIKVRKGDEQLGKVKYYPDTGKLKAKNREGTEIALCKGFHKMSAFIAPFLMQDVPLEQTIFLSLLFLSLGR